MYKNPSIKPLEKPKLLPGKYLNRDQQCEKILPGSKSVKYNCLNLKTTLKGQFNLNEKIKKYLQYKNEDCGKLTCQECKFLGITCLSGLFNTKDDVPVAEGSSCGEKKVITLI